MLLDDIVYLNRLHTNLGVRLWNYGVTFFKFIALVVLIYLLSSYAFSENSVVAAVALCILGVILLCYSVRMMYRDNLRKLKERDEAFKRGKQNIDEELKKVNFCADKEIALAYNSDSPGLKIDVSSERIAWCDYYNNRYKIVPFKTLLECEIVDDNTTILRGGTGRAVVGGVLAGGAGAVVGAATRQSQYVTKNLSVKIITSDIIDPLIVIPLIEKETNRESAVYKASLQIAQEVYSTIVSIIKQYAEK